MRRGVGVEVAAGSDPNDPNSTPVAVPLTTPLGALGVVISLTVAGLGALRRRF